jgi:hypothetical protein
MEVFGQCAVLKCGKLNKKIRNINSSFFKNNFLFLFLLFLLLLLLVSKAQPMQLCVLYVYRNKQQLVANTTLTDQVL